MNGYLLVDEYEEAYGPYDLNTVMKIISYKKLTVLYATNIRKIIKDYGWITQSYLTYDSFCYADIKKESKKDMDAIHFYGLLDKTLDCPEEVIKEKTHKYNKRKSRENSRSKVPKHFWSKVKSEAKANDIPNEYKAYVKHKTRYSRKETPLWWDEFETHRKSNNWKEHRKNHWKYNKVSFKRSEYDNEV